ncbi:MAG: VWA domain-containing protein [Fimbriimonadaceae bacterium]|nr:VWA domain-containing protein [Fimbriimonadaceae bacterium]
MEIVGPDGKMLGMCPLKKTDVQADIAGYGARVNVRQTFTNPSITPIEAIYTFPLPHDAAVDRMSLRMGDRVINAVIKKREEARKIYETAKNQGRVAGLLDQERPNIFTQSVANIMPGATIEVEISYVQILKYEDDKFEFVYPMVVGPRFLGNAPDPGKISPPTAPPGVRVGTDITLKVNLDAGTALGKIESELHQVTTQKNGPNKAAITLAKKDEIPNRDFILRYSVAGNQIQDAFLTHADADKGGFFTLILNPPKIPAPDQIAPKEVIFVIDQSGSQSGFPIDKSKELTKKLIRTLNPNDTFTVLGFSNDVKYLWKTPQKASGQLLEVADKFIGDLQANGGTQLYAAVQAALNVVEDSSRLRLVVFNTDGYVGDESRIIGSIEARSGNTRMFTFGIGNSVNRFLIDEMSRAGRGDAEVVTLAADSDKAVERFVQRTQNPILTDITVKVEGVPIFDVTPRAIEDVFSAKPVVITGRYTQAGRGSITVTGKLGGEPWTRVIPVTFPERDQDGSAISTLWARRHVGDLQGQMMMAQWQNRDFKQFVTEITNIGLRYGIMTEYTSFVAVEQRVVNVGGKQITVDVPVNMADGVDMGSGEMDRRLSPGQGLVSTGATLKGLARGGGGTGGSTGGGGFGGGGSGPPATSSADKSVGGNVAYIGYDPSDNSIVVRENYDLAKALRENPDQVIEIAGMVKPESMAKLVAKLTPADREKFYYITRVSKELRDMKPEDKAMVYITCSEEASNLLGKNLTSSATIDHPAVTGKKLVIAEVTVERLKSIAQHKGIDSIVKRQ